MEYADLEKILEDTNKELEMYQSKFRYKLREDNLYIVLSAECKEENVTVTFKTMDKQTLSEAYRYLQGVRDGLTLSRI